MILFHLDNLLSGLSIISGSKRAVNGQQIKKCPGVKGLKMFESEDKGVIGLELKTASILVFKVKNSIINFEFPIFFLRCVLKDFTPAPQSSPKCSALDGMKCQSISSNKRYSINFFSGTKAILNSFFNFFFLSSTKVTSIVTKYCGTFSAMSYEVFQGYS